MQQQKKISKETQNPKTPKKKKLCFLEWKYKQFLGEKLPYDNLVNIQENNTFLLTKIKISQDGTVGIVCDKGGRVIIFRSYQEKQLDYFFEFQSQEKDFDFLKSIEYPEAIKDVVILPSTNDQKIDLVSASFRRIKFDRVYSQPIKTFSEVPDNLGGSNGSVNVVFPNLKNVVKETKTKSKKTFKNVHSNEINSLCMNTTNDNQIISSDEYKIFLWDVNYNGDEVYNPVDLDNGMETEETEKITKCTYSNINPNVFLYGTDYGNIKVCDLRSSTDQLSFQTNYSEEKMTGSNFVSQSILSVQDISSKLNDSYSFVTRNYFSLNFWDIRKQSCCSGKILLYEPNIKKLPYLFSNNYLRDKFSISTDKTGNYILTGGYNNMFHVVDIKERLNSQIVIDDTNEKLLNRNVIRKINSKGQCDYKDVYAMEKYPYNYNNKIICHDFSQADNFIIVGVQNCIYTYSGNLCL